MARDVLPSYSGGACPGVGNQWSRGGASEGATYPRPRSLRRYSALVPEDLSCPAAMILSRHASKCSVSGPYVKTTCVVPSQRDSSSHRSTFPSQQHSRSVDDS